MYREHHLQVKSAECSALWREWFSLWKEGNSDHWVVREKWNKCTDELAEMLSHEVKTNPRYNSIRKI